MYHQTYEVTPTRQVILATLSLSAAHHTTFYERSHKKAPRDLPPWCLHSRAPAVQAPFAFSFERVKKQDAFFLLYQVV